MVTAGIQDLVIVQRGKYILICHKNLANRLKELLAKLSR
jgi:MannoseP isomerase/GMP-like beta-helix domain